MLTGIDHLMICVPDLAAASAQYAKLGFNVTPGGKHPGKGTHNAIAFNDADYIELLAIHDADEYARGRGSAARGPGLPAFITAGGGIRYIVVRSDDLVADVAAMRARGVDVEDPVDGSRQTPAGNVLRWRVATLGERNPLPLFFIEHLTPLAERRGAASAPSHPNGVVRLERTYIVTDRAEALADDYARVLGLPRPKMERGTVIMADMAVFRIGPNGLGIAEPYTEGVADRALRRRGPGPFQALYRTTSMDGAAKWISDHGVPPPARGVRNTGEVAMLVPPPDACGAYIGFVGMP